MLLALTNRKMMPFGGLGRRGGMICSGVAFFAGALLLAAARHWVQLVEGHIFIGIGIGFINAVRMRGRNAIA